MSVHGGVADDMQAVAGDLALDASRVDRQPERDLRVPPLAPEPLGVVHLDEGAGDTDEAPVDRVGEVTSGNGPVFEDVPGVLSRLPVRGETKNPDSYLLAGLRNRSEPAARPAAARTGTR
jgi:hypothetical protein